MRYVYRRQLGEPFLVTTRGPDLISNVEKRPRGGSDKYVVVETTYREVRELMVALECGHTVGAPDKMHRRHDGSVMCMTCTEARDGETVSPSLAKQAR